MLYHQNTDYAVFLSSKKMIFGLFIGNGPVRISHEY
ncbi:hypothetical protein MED193_11752 [Roseobacter sp. MED193]|nr:hypothetical protein MED193_11752 [Roseobacter sp. MED193]